MALRRKKTPHEWNNDYVMGMFKVADMKGDKRYDTYKLTKQ